MYVLKRGSKGESETNFCKRTKSAAQSGLATLKGARLALRPVDKLILSRLDRLLLFLGVGRGAEATGGERPTLAEATGGSPGPELW